MADVDSSGGALLQVSELVVCLFFYNGGGETAILPAYPRRFLGWSHPEHSPSPDNRVKSFTAIVEKSRSWMPWQVRMRAEIKSKMKMMGPRIGRLI